MAHARSRLVLYSYCSVTVFSRQIPGMPCGGSDQLLGRYRGQVPSLVTIFLLRVSTRVQARTSGVWSKRPPKKPKVKPTMVSALISAHLVLMHTPPCQPHPVHLWRVLQRGSCVNVAPAAAPAAAASATAAENACEGGETGLQQNEQVRLRTAIPVSV